MHALTMVACLSVGDPFFRDLSSVSKESTKSNGTSGAGTIDDFPFEDEGIHQKDLHLKAYRMYQVICFDSAMLSKRMAVDSSSTMFVFYIIRNLPVVSPLRM